MKTYVSKFSCTLTMVLFCGIATAQEQPDEKPTGSEEKPATTQPAAHEVQPKLFQVKVPLKGMFEAGKMAEVEVRPKTATTLTVKKAVRHGKHVKKGEPLVWLDPEKLDEQIRAAEHDLKISNLTLKVSEAELELAEATHSLDMKAVDRAKKRAEEDLKYYTETTRPMAEKSAEFSLRSAEYSLEYAQEELDQLQKMYEADDLTEETEEIVLKRARRAVESSKHFLETAQIRHERTLQHDLPQQLIDLSDATQRQILSWTRNQRFKTQTRLRQFGAFG